MTPYVIVCNIFALNAMQLYYFLFLSWLLYLFMNCNVQQKGAESSSIKLSTNLI